MGDGTNKSRIQVDLCGLSTMRPQYWIAACAQSGLTVIPCVRWCVAQPRKYPPVRQKERSLTSRRSQFGGEMVPDGMVCLILLQEESAACLLKITRLTSFPVTPYGLTWHLGFVSSSDSGKGSRFLSARSSMEAYCELAQIYDFVDSSSERSTCLSLPSYR
jgi:hypothetical protein